MIAPSQPTQAAAPLSVAAPAPGTIHVVTAASRPENLARVGQSIVGALHMCTSPIECRWYIVKDESVHTWEVPDDLPLPAIVLSCREPGEGGNPARNVALEHIADGHVLFLDDDTTMHECYLTTLMTVLDVRPDAAVIVSQQRCNQTIRCHAAPENMAPCQIDTGQGCIPRDLIGAYRWETWSPLGDGLYYQHVYQQDPSRFVFLAEPLAIYNALRC